MGSVPTPTPIPSFKVLRDTLPNDVTLPPFMVSTPRGFLPRVDPPATLPPEFAPLESLLQRMPIKTISGSPGLLATSSLKAAVDGTDGHDKLPDLTESVDKYKENLVMVNALYRDYSFLASAYLLEPCHERFVAAQKEGKDKDQVYGLGRDVLPKEIARPIVRCAEILDFKPFMEYAGSYALYNYRLENPTLGLDYSNLRLIRAFEHGLDPTSSEAGFVLVHIEMVKHTGPLVAGATAAIEACSHDNGATNKESLSTEERSKLNDGLTQMLDALRTINSKMETMWARSKPASYTSFRTFIFGITSQSMFPRGVLYEGVFDSTALPPPSSSSSPQCTDAENLSSLSDPEERTRGTRLQFRGESGANDSIVPLCDNLLSIPMPSTPLTQILKDFRSYRPSNHRQFLEYVKATSQALNLRELALALSPSASSPDAATQQEVAKTRTLWLLLLDQVREFRWRHWCFAREYIIKRTAHPTATGGSPIVTWLPNQLAAVLAEMENVYGAAGRGGLGKDVEQVMDLAARQKVMLEKEVQKYCQERGVTRE